MPANLSRPPLTCLIVDDEVPAHQVIQSHLAKLPQFTLAGQCYTGLEAHQFLSQQPVDVVFLDIDMPELSGLELLRSLPLRPPVVLTTAYAQYALESYELSVVDYLLKPIAFPRFLQAAQKVLSMGNGQSAPAAPMHLEVKVDGLLHRVATAELHYIEGWGNYAKLYVGGRMLLVLDTLQHWEQNLPKGQFCRIHKSFIVNLSAITRLTPDGLLLTTGACLPIGRRYAALFEVCWHDYQAGILNTHSSGRHTFRTG